MKYQYLFLLSFLCLSTFLVDPKRSDRYFSSKVISKEKLKKEIIARMERVDELRAMKELAVELGIKNVYLFGGSAAAWAHYVYWDLEREAGIGNYDQSRFDYDYTSIFRSNQDMDIVIDVTKENISLVSRFEKTLQERFSHFQGNKTAWEVRPLRIDYGDKEKILNNSDFLAQNSDSHSTGLISLTGNDEIAIRDFKDWMNPHNYFIRDVYNRELHYYRNRNLHQSTRRFKKGLNPEIFSVIRYLTKAFQYELKIDELSLEDIKEVLSQFNPSEDLKEGYAKKWVEKNSKKLYQNAIDLEFAYRLMSKLKLQEKLKLVDDDELTIDSMAWWMNKVPLLTKPLGNPSSGKTAHELGIAIVAHETRYFSAYESITKSHSGLANVFISRADEIGEMALHGEGFYTRIGEEGARGTGLTIRFNLHPKAIEGVDFVLKDEFVIVKNKAAISVISESLNISIVEYFKKLAKGELIFDESDKGVLEKVRRKMGIKSIHLTKEEKEDILKIINIEIEKASVFELNELLIEWFSLKISAEYPQLLKKLIEKSDITELIGISHKILGQEHWQNHPELIHLMIDRSQGVNNFILEFVLSKPYWTQHPELISRIIKEGGSDFALAKYILGNEQWENHPELVEMLLERESADHYIVQYVLGKPHWSHRTDWVEKIIARTTEYDKYLIQFVLSQPHFAHRLDWAEKIFERNHFSSDMVQFVLVHEEWKQRPEMIEKFINSHHLSDILGYVLNKPHWADRPDIIHSILDRFKDFDRLVASSILSEPHWVHHSDLLFRLIERGQANETIASWVLRSPLWKNHPEAVEKIIDSDIDREYIEINVLNREHWINHPYFKEKLKGKELTYDNIRSYLRDEKSCQTKIGKIL